MWGVMLEVGSRSKDAVHFVHSQMTNLFFVPSLFFDCAPARQKTRTFFSGHNNYRATARQMTRTFFSGRNNDRAPARQTTRTLFSGCNNDRAPARQTTRTFFLTWRNQFLLVNLEEPISSGYPAHVGLTWRNQFLLVTQPT